MTKEEQQPFHDHSRCQSKSGEKQSVDAISPATCIPYPRAMMLLQVRIPATPEDMAAWVFYGPEMGGLRVYQDVVDDPQPFNYAIATAAGFKEYLTPLMHCWFLKKDIDNFYPAERYITGEELIKWSTQPGIQPKAYMAAKVWESRLMDLLPIFEGTEASFPNLGPPIETGLFAISQIEAIEAFDFGNDKCNRASNNREPSRFDHDPEMQQRANEIAAALKQRAPWRVPTRHEVAKILASEVGMLPETALRRIRNQWKR